MATLRRGRDLLRNCPRPSNGASLRRIFFHCPPDHFAPHVAHPACAGVGSVGNLVGGSGAGAGPCCLRSFGTTTAVFGARSDAADRGSAALHGDCVAPCWHRRIHVGRNPQNRTGRMVSDSNSRPKTFLISRRFVGAHRGISGWWFRRNLPVRKNLRQTSNYSWHHTLTRNHVRLLQSFL